MIEGHGLPSLATPNVSHVDLVEWARNHRAKVSALLEKHGAVLFRGFEINTVEKLRALTVAVSGEPMEYMEQRSRRKSLGAGAYTSTIHAADQYIHFHNESSYSRNWPMRLHFCCIRPAERGGWTPIADSRRVFQQISSSTKEPFVKHGVLYIRNFRRGLGLSWQEAFQTSSRNEVERYCAQSDIQFEWLPQDGLRTRQLRCAVANHPTTGELVWFNQAHHFHPHSLAAELRNKLFSMCSDDNDLPSQVYYGNGSPIQSDTIDEIIAAYRLEEVGYAWQSGDLLIVDNMLVAHSRTPYTGDRLIALTLSNPRSDEWQVKENGAIAPT